MAIGNSAVLVPALRVDNVSIDFSGVHALKHVSFTVPSGQRVALIGPNGAGKSTLLNIINGQAMPSEGRIHFFETDVTQTAIHERARLGIARSFQVSSVFPELSVLRNAWLAIAGMEPWSWKVFHNSVRRQSAVRTAGELLRAWGLWDRRHAPAGSIAHGEQRMLETVMALAYKPRLLLLDEPSAGLTVEEGQAVLNRLRMLDRGTTILLVAHDMDLVFGVSDRIVVLHHGEIIADGTTDEVARDPKVRDVYMGSS